VLYSPATNVEEDAQDIEAAIRAKLASGELPRAKPAEVWAGKGTNQPCTGCGERIGPSDVECEVDVPGGPPAGLRFHRRCLIIWDQERGLQQPMRNKSGPDADTAA
jgi:hypothetical protein